MLRATEPAKKPKPGGWSLFPVPIRYPQFVLSEFLAAFRLHSVTASLVQRGIVSNHPMGLAHAVSEWFHTSSPSGRRSI